MELENSFYTKIKKALVEIYKTGEAEKLLKYAKGSEKRRVKHDIKILAEVVEIYENNGEDINTIPVFSFITELKSASVLLDAITFASMM